MLLNNQRPSYRPSLRNAHKRIMAEVPLYKGISTICSCGGRTRTCDLQVMSLASYQLLHSAILTIAIRLTRSISELRVQRYDFLVKPPNVFAIIFLK